MASNYEQENILNPYVRQLNLTWPLSTEIYDGIITASMISDPTNRTHRLLIPTNQRGQLERHRSEVVKILCRAKLGESRDPLFSTIRFDPQLEQFANFGQIASTINLLQSAVEVWAADVMAAIDISLVEKETTDMLRHINGLASVHLQRMRREAFIGYAVNHADMVRHGFSHLAPFDAMALQKMRTSFGEHTAAVAQDLAQHYANLPILPADSTEALHLLEDVTQYTANATKMNVKPVVKTIDGPDMSGHLQKSSKTAE